MAGFWKTMKRLLVGEPVFQVNDTQTSEANLAKDTAGKWQDSVLPDDTGTHTENPDAYKPVYIEEDMPQTTPEPEQAEAEQPITETPVDESGNKLIPEVEVVSCQTYLKGDKCEVWANIKNHSDVEIELDAIDLLGTRKELDRRLLPGDEHEFNIYYGDMPHDDHSREAELTYKSVQAGDYFCARHIIEYEYESDGTYMIEEMRLLRPIRDI